jgi:hypothetical protein
MLDIDAAEASAIWRSTAAATAPLIWWRMMPRPA